jgi:hypothetical protein
MPERNRTNTIPSEFPEDIEEVSLIDAYTSSTPLFACKIFKQTSLRKNWREKYLYVTEMGLLVYKNTQNDKNVEGKMQLTDCDWFRTTMNVKKRDRALSEGDDEIDDTETGK